MLEEGDTVAGGISCSQSIGVVNLIEPVAGVIDGLVRQAAAIRDGLTSA